jgi:outer membrane protein assembly factor BamB
VKIGRSQSVWARRAVLAVVLVGAAVIPGRASSLQTKHCSGRNCRAAGSILWTSALPGSWQVQPGATGTVTSQDAAYAAVGGGVAVVGSGTRIAAFDAATGHPLWQTSLASASAGVVIVSVRAFAGVVAVGIEPSGGGNGGRQEEILSASTGQPIRTYPAADYGGAIQADRARTVIVGTRAVIAYSNATGREVWSRPTGPGDQAWRVAGNDVFVTGTAARGADAGRITALRRINLRTGAEQVVRLHGRAVGGTLSDVVDAPGGLPVALFSSAGGVLAYDAADGRLLWPQAGAVLELTDNSAATVYLARGSALRGIDAGTGTTVSTTAVSVAGSLYSVSGGVAFALDQGGIGEAWGYDLVKDKIVWTSGSQGSLPWPHFFVDLSGLGGSASPGTDIVVVAICAKVGKTTAAASAPACARPELAAVLG